MIAQFALPEIPISYRGKVRDIYDLNDKLVIIASDRVSAFDVVFDQIIPDKGRVLTGISNHWFSLIQSIPNHILETDVSKFPKPFSNYKEILQGRSVLVKKAKRIDIECIARGYLLGSAYKEYVQSGSINGMAMPKNLRFGGKLPFALFTPSTKADTGHDENVNFDYIVNMVGEDLAVKLKEETLKLYNWAEKKLEPHGLILADTKFEFGFVDNELTLIDEVLTPDSSRFFYGKSYDEEIKTGKVPQSMDKQIIRDYLEKINWNKMPPPPELPENIIEKTIEKYREIEQVIKCIS